MNKWLAIAIALALAFVISAVSGKWIIPWLHKLKYGQTILDIGPSWHKKKQGTPTMGGIMFIIASVLSIIITVLIFTLTGGNIADELNGLGTNSKVLIYAGIFLALGQGVVGFADDYISVVKKRNEGLTPKQKTLGQIIIGVGYLLALYLSKNTWFYLPFASGEHIVVELGNSVIGGIVFWLGGIFLIYGFSNAVNLTDGIDGLCASVTTVVSVALLVVSVLHKFAGVSIYAAAIAGGCAGYLIWNHYPAKVFMGDTGSLFLGGSVMALAFALHIPYIILIMGIVYVCETGSVMLQVSYYKLTKKIYKDKDENGNLVGRRIFKMTPIHHHFEMSGWKETKIVSVFSIVSVIASAVAVAIVYFGIFARIGG